MQIYLLSINVLAWIAWILGLLRFSGPTRFQRLLPLFLLTITRLLALIITLTRAEPGPLSEAFLHTLEGVSTFCLIWIFIPFPELPASKQFWMRRGAAWALLLSLVLLIPSWPLPVHIHTLFIALLGTVLIYIGQGRIHWVSLIPPLILSLAHLFHLMALNGIAEMMIILVYLMVAGVVYSQTRPIDTLPPSVPRKKDEAIKNVLQQRVLELSATLSAVPNLSQAMEYIARTMAVTTHSDQAIIFTLENAIKKEVRLVTVYSPERPVHLQDFDELTFPLAESSLLKKVMESQKSLHLPSPPPSLRSLYAWWDEKRVGPTLLQPLIIRDRPIGVLMICNPVTQRSIRENDIYLCRRLASQIATMVEQHRRYIELKRQTQALNSSSIPLQGSKQKDDYDYKTVLEAIGEGIIISDISGHIQLVNRAAEHILEKSRQTLLGQPIRTLSSEFEQAISESGQDKMISLSTFIEQNKRTIHSQLMPWHNEAEEPLGTIAIFRDVTPQVRVHQTHNNFISTLSHELETSLKTVRGYSKLVGEINHEVSPQQRRIQRVIQSNTDRMLSILEDAKQLNLQESYRLQPNFEKVNILEVATEALQRIEPLLQLRELHLIQEFEDQLPPLPADPAYIRKILDNLLSNACRFTPPSGQIILRIQVQSEDHLLITIIDNGVGIPDEKINQIFDPFYRIKNHSLDSEQGLGMGLAVVKELVQLHQGQVWVESIVGEGSKFHVSLPLKKTAMLVHHRNLPVPSS